MGKVVKKRVMLIDDNEIDIFINQKVLEFNDFASEVVCIEAAQNAIDFIKDCSADRLPEVIFLDLNMPVVDGFRFLFEFSQLDEKIRAQIKIIILTSSDNARDKEKAAANPDVITYISKPLTEDKLNSISSMI